MTTTLDSQPNLGARSTLNNIKNNFSRLSEELSEQKRQNAQLTLQYEQLKARHDALLAKDKPIHEFISLVGHELRTPLNAIIGLSSLLKLNIGGELSETNVSYTSVINEAGHSLLDIINQLLDYSKLQAGQLDVQVEEVGLQQVLKDLGYWAQPLFTKSELTLEVLIDPSVVAILSDENKIIQLTKQFLNNALKFTNKGGVKLVLAQPSSREYAGEIWVHDTGSGISESKLKVIFEQFEQGEKQLARRHEGLGLGLSIAQKLAQALGIKICVMSEVNKGTTVKLMLPHDARCAPSDHLIEVYAKQLATDAPAEYPQIDQVIKELANSALETAAINSSEIFQNGNKTLLVVDDNVKNLFTLTSVLQDYGFNVVTAENGLSALEKLKTHPVQAVLTDIAMPEMNGYELTQHIRSDNCLKEMPIIVISANASKEAEEDSLSLGADAFLTKPFNMSTLLDRVNKYL